MVGQVVFQEGIVYERFWAAFNGFLKLNFYASAKSVVDLSSPSSSYAAEPKVGLESRARALNGSNRISRLNEDLRFCLQPLPLSGPMIRAANSSATSVCAPLVSLATRVAAAVAAAALGLAVAAHR